MFLQRLLLFSICGLFLLSCSQEKESVKVERSDPINYPSHFGAPIIPADSINTMSEDAIILGRYLFYDVALSNDSSISCASCHKQQYAFADNVSISPGVDGSLGFRNAPSVLNMAYQSLLFWDGGVSSLEKQVLIPIHDTLEMNYSLEKVVERLKVNKVYQELAEKAYGRSLDMFVITRAIAQFERSLLSYSSKYDMFYLGDESVFTAQEIEGKQLFESDRLKCAKCHSGPLFTDFSFRNNGAFKTYTDSGRARATFNSADRNLFKVPSLRNVMLTGPYMHNGGYQTISDVIDSYSRGGFHSAEKDSLVTGFELSLHEKEALIAFLHCLTDSTILNNTTYADPFE